VRIDTGNATTGNSIPFWYSPRQVGTLQEKQAWHEELRSTKGQHLPAYMVRDRGYMETVKLKGLTHERLGLSNGELHQPTPFSLNNSFFSKRDGEFLSLAHRQSVTRHHWGVLNFTDNAGTSASSHAKATGDSKIAQPQLNFTDNAGTRASSHAKATGDSKIALPQHKESQEKSDIQARSQAIHSEHWVANPARPGEQIVMQTAHRAPLPAVRRSAPAASAKPSVTKTLPGPAPFRTEDGLRAGFGFEPADKRGGKWVLQYVPARAAPGESVSSIGGVHARTVAFHGASARDSARTGGRPRSKSVMSATHAPEDEGDVDPAKGRTGAALQALHAERKRKQQEERRLLKTLRTKMQLRFKETSHLPINLWKVLLCY
jgi:hypothetical protein